MHADNANQKDMKKKSNPLIDLTFVSGLIIYSVLALILIDYYRYIINPDGVSYISITQKYLRGDFKNAINATFGPLISWLLVPFLILGFDPLYATKLLLLSIGFVAMVGIRLLSYRFEMSQYIRNIIFFLLIPFILYLALTVITTDLLVACILVFYLNIIFAPTYSQKIYSGILCGLLGGLAYLAKNYAFPFFIIHFPLFNLLHYLRNDSIGKTRVIKNFIVGFIVFILISGAWILMLSSKYGELTIGSAGRYLYAYVGPYMQYRHNFEIGGLLEPPNKTAIVASEDLSYFKVKLWNPLKSFDHFIHLLRAIKNNTKTTVYSYLRFSLLSPAILLGYILVCMRSKKLFFLDEPFYPVITSILYTIGFLPLFVEARHLWLNFILLGLMAGPVLDLLFKNSFFNDSKKRFTLIFFILSCAAIPLGIAKIVVTNNHLDKYYFDLCKELKNKYNIQGNIASNGNWPTTVTLSYHLKTRYYGMPRNNFTYDELRNDLKKYNIDYYFVWGKLLDKEARFLVKYKEVTKGTIPDLGIYSLKE